MKKLFQAACAELLSLREDVWSSIGNIADDFSPDRHRIAAWIMTTAKRHADGISARKRLHLLETDTALRNPIMIDDMAKHARAEFAAAGKPVTEGSRMDKRIKRAVIGLQERANAFTPA